MENKKMSKYDKMTQQEFDDILEDLVRKNAANLLNIPGVYEAVAEHFNNEVLETWEEQQN